MKTELILSWYLRICQLVDYKQIKIVGHLIQLWEISPIQPHGFTIPIIVLLHLAHITQAHVANPGLFSSRVQFTFQLHLLLSLCPT